MLGFKIVLAVLGGLVLSAVTVMHSAGPALMVLASTPFDPLMTNLFGLAGNNVTMIPIILVLIKVGPGMWADTFFGTRVQVALFLFIAVTSISYAIGYTEIGIGAFYAYIQKLSGFFLVGVLAVGLRNNKHVDFCLKVLVVSMVFFSLVSMVEFYLGITIFPTQSEFGAGGLLEAERTSNVHEARLRGAGNSVSINAFALGLLVPIGLAMGWASMTRRSGSISVPIICLIVLLAALVGTISRAGLLALVVGAAVVMVAAYRLNPVSVMGTLILAGVLALGANAALSRLDLGDEFESRLTSSSLERDSSIRQGAWLHGLKLFADSPIWGAGYGVHVTQNVKRSVSARDPHNHYIRILAYYGSLGASFFAYLVWATFSTLSGSTRKAADRVEYWRPYILAGFVSLLFLNLFNSYFFDRMMFIVIGFAAALEQSRREVASESDGFSKPEPEPLHDWAAQGERAIPPR